MSAVQMFRAFKETQILLLDTDATHHYSKKIVLVQVGRPNVKRLKYCYWIQTLLTIIQNF